ncbi:MAG TPA: sulfurtransferase [Ktedonobacteraceae bacterium]|nr:sulfurtransferase [Ktedonobacteraceae bacterium]
MAVDRNQFLVETSWLAEHLYDPQVRVVDMRGYVRLTNRPGVEGHHDAQYVGAREEYEKEHIPEALYVDWSSDIVDPADDVEAQIAPPARFAQMMEQLGIGDQHLVVAYDAHPASQFATRFWWALNYYGHKQVVVLNGGYLKWKREGRPLTDAVPTYAPAVFTPRPQPEMRATAAEVLSLLKQPGVNLVDARDQGQYSGTVVRGEGRRGHIPGAINVPREDLIASDGTFRSNEEIQRIFAQAGVSPEQHVVAYCNGGVAATSILFSLALLGYPHLTNYDGSWNEWGERQDLPVEL